MKHYRCVARCFLVFAAVACLPAGNANRNLSRGEAAFKVAKETLETMSKSAKLKENFKNLVDKLSAAGQACAAVGAILGFAVAFLPDHKHEAILLEFKRLHVAISDARNDIRNFHLETRYSFAVTVLHNHLEKLQLATEYAAVIGDQMESESSRLVARQRLNRLNSNEELTVALRSVANNLGGRNRLSNNILRAYYDHTVGHKPKLVELSEYLSRAFMGGSIALMMDEQFRHQNDSIEVRESALRSREATLNRSGSIIADAITEITNRCERTEEFESNMEKDIKRIIAVGGSNNAIADTIAAEFGIKYDFLYYIAIVFDALIGWKNNYFYGPHVAVLREREKSVVLYYRRLSDGITHWTWAQDHVQQILQPLNLCKHARLLAEGIIEGHLELMLGYTCYNDYWGIAVFRRHKNHVLRTNYDGKIAYDRSNDFDIYIPLA